MIHEFGVREGRIASEPDGRAALHESGEALRALSAQGDDRGRAPTRTSSSSTRRNGTRSPLRTSTRRSDYNLYEGTEVVGDVETVLLRGQVIVDGGELVAKPGVGQFVKRARFGEQLTPAAPVEAAT